ncbi:type II secretion system protein GspM [Sphingomonas adhaesiva]|uniref:type II secretion system protein GspM n=1 Tax=Sphingomonas adhaesiva TaxID=28212 RepID=UPI002FFC64D4
MSTALRAWFDARSLRERRLILVMAALLMVTILWAGIIRPVRAGLSDSRERYTQAVVRLGAAEAALSQVKAIQRRQPPTPNGLLADVVRARAEAAGLTLAGLDSEAPDRVRVTIATARAGALTQWIAALEGEGVLVDSLTISGAGGTAVSAQMTLTARGN